MGYLVEHLLDVGPVMPGGFGPAVLSHGEIRAWQDNTGIELQPWEVAMMRRLSGEYLKASAEAEKQDAPPPFGADRQERLRDVAEALRTSLRAG